MEKNIDQIPHDEKQDSKVRKTLYKRSLSDEGGSRNVSGPTSLEKKSPFPQGSLDSLEIMNADPEAIKKPRFSISLTPEEIEEDIFLMTGLKPAKKPKKRPEEVQKQIDKVFPGMKFAIETPDASNIVCTGTSPPPSASSNVVKVDRKSDSSKK